jgi:hypothetical protein
MRLVQSTVRRCPSCWSAVGAFLLLLFLFRARPSAQGHWRGTGVRGTTLTGTDDDGEDDVAPLSVPASTRHNHGELNLDWRLETELGKELALYQWRHKAAFADAASHDGRVVIYTAGHNGLGNRLTALVSSFLLALLTDAVLLIDWQTPTDIETQFAFADGLDYSLRRFEALRGRPLSPGSKLNLREDQLTPLCGDPDRGALGAQIVHIADTDQHFACFLANNKRLRPRISALFSFAGSSAPELMHPGRLGLRAQPNQLYAPLEQFLLRPSAQVQAALDAFAARFSGRFVVGVQCRLEVVRDVTGLRIDPEAPEPVLHRLWQAAERMVRGPAAALLRVCIALRPIQLCLFV